MASYISWSCAQKLPVLLLSEIGHEMEVRLGYFHRCLREGLSALKTSAISIEAAAHVIQWRLKIHEFMKECSRRESSGSRKLMSEEQACDYPHHYYLF